MSCCVFNDYQMGSGRMNTEYTCKDFGYGRCGRCCNHDYYLVKGIVDVEKINNGCPYGGNCPNRCGYYNNYNHQPCNRGCGCNNNFFNTYFLLKLFM